MTKRKNNIDFLGFCLKPDMSLGVIRELPSAFGGPCHYLPCVYAGGALWNSSRRAVDVPMWVRYNDSWHLFSYQEWELENQFPSEAIRRALEDIEEIVDEILLPDEEEW